MGSSEGSPSPHPDSASPSPLEVLPVTGVTAATVGTAVWGVVLTLCLARREQLAAAGHGTWVEIAAAGVLLGLIAIRYTRRRARRLGL